MDNSGTQRLERIQDMLCIYNDSAHWDQQALVVIRSGSYLLEIGDSRDSRDYLYIEDDLPVALMRRMAERIRDDADAIREQDNDIARLSCSLAQAGSPMGLRDAKELVERIAPLVQYREDGGLVQKIQAIKLVRQYTDKREG